MSRSLIMTLAAVVCFAAIASSAEAQIFRSRFGGNGYGNYNAGANQSPAYQPNSNCTCPQQNRQLLVMRPANADEQAVQLYVDPQSGRLFYLQNSAANANQMANGNGATQEAQNNQRRFQLLRAPQDQSTAQIKPPVPAPTSGTAGGSATPPVRTQASDIFSALSAEAEQPSAVQPTTFEAPMTLEAPAAPPVQRATQIETSLGDADVLEINPPLSNDAVTPADATPGNEGNSVLELGN